MTRKECETKLVELAEHMRALYMQYNTAGDFMTVIIDGNGYINIEDSTFNADGHMVRDVHGNVYKTVSVTRYSDGSIEHKRSAGRNIA